KSGRFNISMHLALAYGDIYFQDLGYDYIFGGGIWGRVMKLLEIARPGEIILDDSIIPGLEKHKVSKERGGCYKLISAPSSLKKRLMKTPALKSTVSADLNSLTQYLSIWLINRVELRPVFDQKDGEHRKLVSVFLHFSGLPFDSNPKLVSKLLSDHYKVILDLIEKYGGWLNKTDIFQDSLRMLVVFGFPKTFENSEHRAVLFINDLRAHPKLRRFHIHGGMYSGFSFATPIGSALRREYTVIGDAVNLAARLGGVSRRNEILVSREIQEKTNRFFKFKFMGRKRFKGKTALISYYMFKEKKSVSPAPVSRWLSETENIVGRRRDLERFRVLKADVTSGKGRILGVSGEAGVGKSRLIREFIKELESDKFTFLTGDCISYGKAMSYLPWIEVLSEFFSLLPEDLPELRKSKIELKIKKVNKDLVNWLPVLGEVLGINFPETNLTRSLDPKIRKQKFFDIVFDLIKFNLKKAPACIIIEDLHWSDSVSLELLNYISRNISGLNILFILVFRPIELREEFKDHAYYSEIKLKELNKSETVKLVENLLNIKSIPDILRNVLVSRSQGNPFYLEEIIKSLIEQGYITEKRRNQWGFSGDLKKLTLPENVEGVILSRIDRLDLVERDVIQTASVIGREFDEFILDGVYPDKKILSRALSNLKNLDLLKVKKSKKDMKYFFKHILTREVAY
ncbi:MAG TPA: hypothetical protein ENN73_02120, partial [Firmicutes bacterium]|nr:hypothetical protein [Bacillota bacterium]